METQEFRDGIERLEKIASHGTTAYMCSEAVWWRCHRSMISDFLLSRGWTVLHIMALGKVMEHSYTAPAYLIWEALISRRRIRECIPYTIISLTNRFRDTPEVIETETITKAHHKKTSRSREVSEAIM